MISDNIKPTEGSVLRSSLFMLGHVLSIFVFAPLSLFTFPMSFRWRYRFISQWARFNLWWLRVTCKLRYEVEGREHIPSGPAVILCKHQSAFETLVLQRIFPPQVWVLKRELLWIPFFGWGLSMLEPIAIDRSAGHKALHDLVEKGRRRLASGRWVVIFPEGTRVAPGAHGRYAPGGAILAQRAGCVVVPVAHNAGVYWPKRGFLKHPGVIRVAIGPTIETQGRSAQEITRLSEEWIEAKVVEIGVG